MGIDPLCNLVFLSNFVPLKQWVCMKDIDIHKVNIKLEAAIKRLKNSNIPEQDKALIFKFKDYVSVMGLSNHRILKYLDVLRKIAEWIEVPFEKATKEHIMNLVLIIQKKEEYTERTKLQYKVMLKKFYKWLRNKDIDDIDEWITPKEVKWIKTTIPKNKKKLPEELINIQDVEKMIKSADHPRDKAFVSLLYESGFRIEELLTLYIKNVALDEYGAKIMIRQGKTGMRPVRVVASAPYLSSWLENHPLGDNPEAPLWVGIGTRNKNKMFCYENARTLIRKIVKKANIKKRIHPHLFRHSRVTYFSKKKFTHEQLCQYFGWVDGSEMPSLYTHLAARDIEDEILNLNGIKIENEEDKHEFVPKKCHRCKEMNPPVSKFCLRCGTPLDQKTAIMAEEKRKEMDDVMTILLKDLLKDPEIQTRIENKLAQIKAKA